MRCAGCDGAFARGESIRGGGAGFVHNARECVVLAARNLQLEAASGQGGEALRASKLVAAVTAVEARACSGWARLEREFALSDGRAATEAGGLLLPRHDRATFVEFIRWLASGDAAGACSMNQLATAVRTFTAQTRLVDWCADSEVSGLMGQLARRAAEASDDE